MKNLYYPAKLCLVFFLFICQKTQSQSIGTFTSVPGGGQTPSLVIPATHTFQRIIKSGDALTNPVGSLGNDLDFTGYVPIGGSSRNGYLSISSESTPAAVAIMTVTYDYPSHTWLRSNSGNVLFQAGAGGPFGTVPVTRFCSGTVTPNGTIMVSEENMAQADTNGDGYNDDGWIIEINPATKSVIESDATHAGLDKLWAIGRQARENTIIMPDNRTLYTGADNGAANSFLYKFVANTPGNFSSGQLFVLMTTGAFGTGTWKLLNNATAPQRNTILTQSLAAPAGFSFDGIEDVERGPDGKIYFTAKGPGRIYRFTDLGATVSGLEIFVANATYDCDPGAGVNNVAWATGNDNLAFDGEGNLWVLNDGGNGHIFVVAPSHTAGSPAVRLFAKTPTGSEPTGITFTPDFRFMFISLQHPSAANATDQLDAAGILVRFNTHTTLVIARRENLGPTATLPLSFTDFKVTKDNNNALLNWSVASVLNHSHFEIERSTDARNFDKIYTETQALPNGTAQSLTYTDRLIPSTAVLVYYRIKQVDINGAVYYSDTKSINLGTKRSEITVFPNPANDILNIDYTSTESNRMTIRIVDGMGRTVFTEKRTVATGKNVLPVEIQKLNKGNYTLFIQNNNNTEENQGIQFTKL